MFNFNRFEELRKEKGITKTFIAEQLNRAPSLCQGWKDRKSEPSPEQLRVVAKLLDTTPEYLMGESNEKRPPAEHDEELEEMLERVRDNPHLRMLFSLTKDATTEDIKQAVKIIQALKGD